MKRIVARRPNAISSFTLLILFLFAGTLHFPLRLAAHTHDFPHLGSLDVTIDLTLQLTELELNDHGQTPRNLLCPSRNFTTPWNLLCPSCKSTSDSLCAQAASTNRGDTPDSINRPPLKLLGLFKGVSDPVPYCENYLNCRKAVEDTVNPYLVGAEGNDDLRQLQDWRQVLSYRGLNRFDHLPALSPALSPALHDEQLAVTEPVVTEVKQEPTPGKESTPGTLQLPPGTLLIVTTKQPDWTQQGSVQVPEVMASETRPLALGTPSAENEIIGQRLELAGILNEFSCIWRNLVIQARGWKLLSEAEQLAGQLSGSVLAGLKPVVKIGAQTLANAPRISSEALAGLFPASPDQPFRQPLFVIYQLEGKEFLMPADLVRCWSYVPQAVSANDDSLDTLTGPASESVELENSHARRLRDFHQRLDQLTRELQQLAIELKEIDRRGDFSQEVKTAGRHDESSLQ